MHTYLLSKCGQLRTASLSGRTPTTICEDECRLSSMRSMLTSNGCTHDEFPVQTLKHAGNEMEILSNSIPRHLAASRTNVQSANAQSKQYLSSSSLHTFAQEPCCSPATPLNTHTHTSQMNHPPKCSASSAFPEPAVTAEHNCMTRESQGSNEMHTLSATSSSRHNSEQQLKSKVK